MLARLKLACVVLIACLPAVQSRAAVMHDSSYNTGIYEALGDQYQGTAMWFTSTDGNTVRQFSGVRIDAWHAVTVAHGFWEGSFLTDTGVGGFGDDIINNPGLTIGIDEIFMHPTWNGNLAQSLANGWADLAVVRFDEAVPGLTLEIGSLLLGEQYDTVGFGLPGTPGLGWLPDDNSRRGFHQYVDSFGDVLSASNYAMSKLLTMSERPDSLAAGGAPGNSGSGGFNAAGELVSIAAANSGAPNYLMRTYNLRLDLYDPWVQTIVPEPATLSLLLIGAFALKLRRRS